MDRQLTDQVMVFKTNIRTEGDVQCVGAMLTAQTCITGWSIDIEDVDCVLRIISCKLQHQDVIKLINM
ncbi:MAG: hypothetical protein ACTHJ0_04695, partial [Flavipsychrobacter sp.]